MRLLRHSVVCLLTSSVLSPTRTRPLSRLQSVSTMRGKDIVLDALNLARLPVDAVRVNECRQTPGALFARVAPTAMEAPQLAAVSKPALALLGWDDVDDEAVLAEFFAGNRLFAGSDPAAHCYAGHQFGHFAGQLGDGAAILLGGAVDPITGTRWELQLKGAGKTPYSRQGDGRKVLRSSLREFVCSEHMAALGVPTTRAATLVYSRATRALRDPFYDGNAVREPCAVVGRLAPHFFRFGSLQLADRGAPSEGDGAVRDALLRLLLEEHFPALLSEDEQQRLRADAAVSLDVRRRLFAAVAQSTARLVARWQALGFVHGVLNTDNLSLAGVTIDYGPFAFLEHVDWDFTPNGSDGDARYSYGRQPLVCRWNLQRLADSLFFAPRVDAFASSEDEHAARAAVADDLTRHFDEPFRAALDTLMRQKLALLRPADLDTPSVGVGVQQTAPERLSDADERAAVASLWRTMRRSQSDFTDTFQALAMLTNDLARAAPDSEQAAAAVRLALERLTSRCATPATLQRLLQRKRRIHRPQFAFAQLQQLASLLAEQPDVLTTRVFPGATAAELSAELRAEARRHALRDGRDYAALLRELRLPLDADLDADLDAEDAADFEWRQLAALDAQEKRRRDEALWRAWLEGELLPRLRARLAPLRHDEARLATLLRLQRHSCPAIVLRSWMLQSAIEAFGEDAAAPPAALRDLVRLLATPPRDGGAADADESSDVFEPQLSSLLRSPGDQQLSADAVEEASAPAPVASPLRALSAEAQRFLAPPPRWADDLFCTCSS